MHGLYKCLVLSLLHIFYFTSAPDDEYFICSLMDIVFPFIMRKKAGGKRVNKYDYLVSQYPDHVVFLKEGRFYLVKSESAYLVNYLFGFRMYFSQDMLCTGCPPELMEKVTEVLKNLQIDYIIVNHDELEEQQEYISNSFRNYENIFHYW